MSDSQTRLALVAGTTATAAVEGLSAAGADPELRAHTPATDAELVAYGRLVRAPAVPVSPTGCPTPAVVTRAARELVGFDALVLDAGLGTATAAPTVDVGAQPGEDVRSPVAVPAAEAVFESARGLGVALDAERLHVAETIPGGTTTAMGVLAALGERTAVSSSLPENPLEAKRRVVEASLAASGHGEGGLAGRPLEAVRATGDPVLAAAAGLAAGALEAGTDVVLAGGTQLATVAALLRHRGVDAPLTVATSTFLAADDSADLRGLADDLDLALRVTDPGFDARPDHPATAGYLAGEAKEGAGMGGALAMVEDAGVEMATLRERVVAVYGRVTDHGPGDRAGGS